MNKLLKKNQYRQLHKFGGSSLANHECYKRIACTILKNSKPGDIIVVSASGNTTNQLIELIKLSCKKSHLAENVKKDIIEYQTKLIKNLLNSNLSKLLINDLEKDINKLTNFLKNDVNMSIYAEIVGYGEIWSARLMSYFLNQENILSSWIDARDFLRAEKSIQPKIDEDISLPLFNQINNKYKNKILIITGFICRDKLGNSMLLGRNGSDYSATEIGYLAKVSCITIWSDVSGVYSADPKKVKNAFLIPLLTFNEANELARLAAPVLHTRTLQPITNSQISLKLKCSFNPNKGSTIISNFIDCNDGAKIITSHENICLVEFLVLIKDEFSEIYKKIISNLKKLQIYPLVITINPEKKLLKCFYTEEVIDYVIDVIKSINLKNVNINKKKGFYLIAIVGKKISTKKEIINKFYNHIKNMPIDCTYLSDDNISLIAIINGKMNKQKITEMHDDLFCVKKRIGLVLFGTGNIGKSWLKLFAKQYIKNLINNNYEIVLAGIIDSCKQMLKYEGINFHYALKEFKNKAIQKDQNYLFSWMEKHPFNELIIIDITASYDLAALYLYFAKNKFHLISANKLAAGEFDIDLYKNIKNAFIKNNCYWFYNATVGAGLPINYTIRDLCDTGDTIFSISGIFSGTLSWLFVKFNGTLTFTELVEKAWKKGLTEPDPRIDLSGKDVTRKLVILAREIGYNINLKQVKVDSIITQLQQQMTLKNFFKKNYELNNYMLEKFKQAESQGCVLRYIARLNTYNNVAKVGIEFLPPNHYLSTISPCDNIFAIKSKWYMKNSLIIRGPGAGKNVTAGAIQSDINRLINLL